MEFSKLETEKDMKCRVPVRGKAHLQFGLSTSFELQTVVWQLFDGMKLVELEF